MNKTLLMDFYELTMSNSYFNSKYKDTICYFDLFYRRNPNDSGYSIFCGLDKIIDYVLNLKFDDSDIEYLRSKNCFSEGFLKYLKNFKFTGDIYSFKEGSVVFPKEPLIVVKAKSIEAQILETYLLLCVNHQSLIATKSRRIVDAAKGRPVMEFGSRRAHGSDAAIYGARASYIAGCVGTACTISDKLFNTPALGTMAHSYIQMYDSEYDAFVAYLKEYPNNGTLLIDTYDVIKSGLPNAVKAFNEVLKPLGITKCGVRIDSGDLTVLTKYARKYLDDAGWNDCKIVVSNSLDEHIITSLLDEGACVDSFGVGENLITSKDCSVFGGVYKLAAIEENGVIIPKIKRSENTVKITNPGFKKVSRIYKNGYMISDIIMLKDEEIDHSKPLIIKPEDAHWNHKKIENFEVEDMLKPIFIGGKLVYDRPSTKEVRDYSIDSYSKLKDVSKRFYNAELYPVVLSDELYNLKYEMLSDIVKNIEK